MKTRIEIIDNTSKVIARRFCYPGLKPPVLTNELDPYDKDSPGFNHHPRTGLLMPSVKREPDKLQEPWKAWKPTE